MSRFPGTPTVNPIFSVIACIAVSRAGLYTISHDITSDGSGEPPPTTCKFTGLEDGKTYYFAATARSQTGESGYSREISYTVPLASVDPDRDKDGYSEHDGDCNDDRASVHPGAEEICGDGIDQDCSGSDRSCVDVTNDSDNDGLTDFEEVYTYHTDPNNADTDGDGFSDGEEVANGFDAMDPSSKSDNELPTVLPLEIGEVAVNDQWQAVALKGSFSEPVVIASALSDRDQDPSVVRVRNVTGSGFEVRVQEWDYLDGEHAIEHVGYIVVESGSYELPGGTRVEAARFNATAVGSFASIQFDQPYGTVPVVMAAIGSVDESDAVAMRIRNVTTSGFEYRMQEQESHDHKHGPEMGGYIAWEPSSGSMDGFTFEIGRTSNVVTHEYHSVPFYEPFSVPPVFLAGMQTTDGGDPATVRWQKREARGIEAKVQEEQSRDTETRHNTEVIGYMVFEAFNPSDNYVAPAEVIVDNDGPGTSYSGGKWGFSSGADPYNGSSRAESRNGAIYTFQAEAIKGDKLVSLYWTYWRSRCSAVPVDIYDGDLLLATVPVDQSDPDLAAEWNDLGTYPFTGTGRVVIRAQDGCSACADAVRFAEAALPQIDYVTIEGTDEVTENTSAQYVLRAYHTDGTDQVIAADSWDVTCPAEASISAAGLLSAGEVGADEPCQVEAAYDDGTTDFTDTHDIVIRDYVAPAEVIVDNDGPGTSYSGGRWGYSSGANPYNGSSRAESRNGAIYTFQAGTITGGKLVSIYWTHWRSRCSAVPVDIYDGDTLLTTVPVDQSDPSLAARWNALGTYPFTGTGRVVIRAQDGCSACADAVKFSD